MATPMEKDIERKLINMVRRYGGKCPKWVSPGWAGVPDRLCLLPGGWVIFAETKRPKGARVAALQKTWRKWLQALGFIAMHIYNEEDLEALEAVIEILIPDRLSSTIKAELDRLQSKGE